MATIKPALPTGTSYRPSAVNRRETGRRFECPPISISINSASLIRSGATERRSTDAGRTIGNVWLRPHILCPSCAVNTPLTMSEHHSSVPSGHACASEKPSPLRPGDGFCLSEPWSGGMSELDKVQPGVNLLSAFTLTIFCALALGLPMAVAIIWVCS